MPIDWEALIAPFRTAYFLQTKSISESLRKIAEWLTKRLKATEERERATRGLQVFGFVGSALSVWIDASQHGALGPEGQPPPKDFWQGAAAPLDSFWRGLLLAESMVGAELALPNILDVLARTVKLITGSLDRFKAPDKGLFDLTTRKRWDDLIGEVGLFFRLINDPATVKQVETFSRGGIELIRVLRSRFPSEAGAKGEGGGLPELTRWIIGGALAVPLIWRLLANIAQTANQVVRLKIIDWATSIQNEVFGFRRDAIDFIYVTLFGFGREALDTLASSETTLISELDLYGRFLKAYFGAIEGWLNTTGKELKGFADGLVKFLYGLGNYLEDFMDVDFGAAISWGIVNFKLSEILEWREDPSKAKDVQEEIDAALNLMDTVASGPLLGTTALGPGSLPLIGPKIDEYRLRLLALRRVVGALGVWTPFPAEAAPPDLSKIAAPNLYQAFFGGPEAATLRTTLEATGSSLKTNLDRIFDAGIDGLTKVGEKMGEAGTNAAKLGSAARYTQVADRAAQLAETAFGADAMRSHLVRRQDPIAAAFESWLSQSGFTLVDRVLPRYVGEMIEYWKREAAKPPAERPTSPHILARRAQVERVRLPRMVIRVNEERELDKVLVAEIAERVRFGVSRAFQIAAAQNEAAAS